MVGISSPAAAPAPLRRSSSHGHGYGHGEEKSTSEGAGEILLLDYDINFDDDIFVGFNLEYGSCDILPDLDDFVFADFSFSSSSGSGEEQEEEEDGSVLLRSAAAAAAAAAERSGENRSGRKLSTTATPTKVGSHGKKKKKKKAKVDWTPELHRRFVQAVEQLGVDKAVPSRILQLMGIDSLTRHNIASHLQKYRSHRKHLLAREVEAASWNQRRQMYAGGGVMKRAVDHMKKHSWQAPPIAGFPPPPPHLPLIRVPLHVWGHPSASERAQLVPVWPRHHLAPPPQPWLPSRPPPVVGPPPPMPHVDPANSFWHPAHYQMALTQGMPFFPPQLLLPAMPRFQAPPVVPSMIHPHDHPNLLIRAAAATPSTSHINAAAATTVNPTSPSSSSCIHSAPAVFDAHPSNEKIDAAIGGVLAKPWSPLPLGLKPPSLESVKVELQRQGVAKVPPSSTSGG